VAFGKTGELLMLRPPAIVIENTLVAVPEATSFTWAVKLKFPELVGVPLMVPPFRLRPAGKLPVEIDHV